MTDLAEKLIKKNEGLRLKPYKCTAGKLTIGYGHNIEDNGISLYVAEVILALDLEACENDLKNFPFWYELSDERRAVLMDMRFQLGLTKFMRFKKMLAALVVGDFETAATELLDSDYAKQTPTRAKANARMMRGKRED